jgi:class 3 adenylate cyclase
LKWELLTDLLPRPIANRLLVPVPLGGTAKLVADVYEDVTVLFTDMKGFTAYSSKLDPGALQHFLNAMFSAFDEILARWGLHKIEVIGDAYFVVSGAPSSDTNQNRTPDQNAGFAAETALDMVRAVNEVCDDPLVRIRVGIHSGTVIGEFLNSCFCYHKICLLSILHIILFHGSFFSFLRTGGVVGQKDPRFHLFGRTVDLANKMEEYGEPDKVHASADCHARLMRLQEEHLASSSSTKGLFEMEDRGMIEISSEPEPVHTYFVLKSSFGRAHRSKTRQEEKSSRGNKFMTANSSRKKIARGGTILDLHTKRETAKKTVDVMPM